MLAGDVLVLHQQANEFEPSRHLAQLLYDGAVHWSPFAAASAELQMAIVTIPSASLRTVTWPDERSIEKPLAATWWPPPAKFR